MITPVLVLSILGLIFGLGLAFASVKFAVQEDPRVAQILNSLPGINCGACGFAGCHALAESVAGGKAPADTCPVGGSESAEKIAAILGVAVGKKVKKVAIVHCGAKYEQRKKKSRYLGVKTCMAANNLSGGENACMYSCLGYGDCDKACPFGAIEMVDGLPKIIPSKCTACGICVKTCPRKIISLEGFDKEKGTVVIACSSLDKAAEVRKICPVGCIACKICEKNSPDGVFEVADNLARIRYKKATAQTNWDICIEKCPNKTIVKIKQDVSYEL